MRRYSAFYFLGQSIKSLWKNGVMTLASILVLLSCLIVTGSFGALIYNINYNMDELSLLNAIVVFIDADKTDEEINEMYQTVTSYNGVKSVEYCSKSQALVDAKEQLSDDGYSHLVESITEENNPLRASFTITHTSDASIEDLIYKLNNLDGVGKIICRSDITEKVNGFRNGISLVLGVFMVILLVVSLFVIINTIKLAVYSRRQEITVMRYIGATKDFITIPFIIEGIIIGALSSVIAFFLEKLMYTSIYNFMTEGYNMIKVKPFSDIMIWVLLGFIAIGVFTGVVGSVISLRKYLKD